MVFFNYFHIKKMQILIIGALSNELKVIKEELKNSKKNYQINYLVSWIWIYETIFSLTKYLENKPKPDFIINIWICGYKENKPNFIQVWRIINLHTLKELLVPIYINFWNIESINCSENIVNDPNFLSENYVDMESWAIEFVVNKYRIPRIILKVPIDKIWTETNNFDYKEALNKLKNNIKYKDILEKIFNYLQDIPKANNFNYLEERYKFSYQELLILKQKISKYETLTNKLFIDFYNKNNILKKEDFLQEFYKLIN